MTPCIECFLSWSAHSTYHGQIPGVAADLAKRFKASIQLVKNGEAELARLKLLTMDPEHGSVPSVLSAGMNGRIENQQAKLATLQFSAAPSFIVTMDHLAHEYSGSLQEYMHQ